MFAHCILHQESDLIGMNRRGYWRWMGWWMAVLWVGCTEVPPPIDLTPPQEDTTLTDTTYTAVGDTSAPPRTVLLEEFTGVKCVTCPQASERVHELDSIHGERLAVIAYHVHDILGAPFSGDPDLRTEQGQLLYEQFWTGGSLPVGMVDRVRFAGEGEVASPQSARWGAYVADRLGVPAPVAMQLTVNDEGGGRFRVRVRARFVEGVNDRVYLTVAVVEDGLIVKQKYPTYVDSAYRLEATFRTMLTPWNGLQWADAPVKNHVRVKEFRLEAPAEWRTAHCKVIAFLHRFSADQYEVLQAVEAPLVP